MRIPLSLGAALVLASAACGDDGGGAAKDGGGSDAVIVVDSPDFLNTPVGIWTWIAVPGTTCGNGSPAGFGINRVDGAQSLYVYFEGGGACWDAMTCFTTHTAVNIDVTYDAAHLSADLGGATTVDRPAGPLAQATYVWVPYCTGDLHAGGRIADYGAAGTVHHTGGQNTQAFVGRLKTKYPTLSTVWLSGSSAGGYGATLELDRFAVAWPTTPVHLLQDSSPFVPVLANYATWQSAWAMDFPDGCADCATSFPAVIDAVAAAHPQSRIGLLTFDDDAIVKSYFGYTTSLVPATNSLVDHQYSHAETRAFVVAGTSHTMLGQVASIPGLAAWIEQWLVGDPAWATVRP